MPCYSWVCNRNFAGSQFAMKPNLDVQNFLCTPVSFPVAAFWWKPTIKLEHSLLAIKKLVRNNSNSSCYHVVHVINEAHVKDENSQKLIFWVACVPLTSSTPLLETIESTLSSVDCSSGQQRWRKLKHPILHERKLDQEEGKKFKLFWGHKNNSIRFLLLW